MSMATAAVLVGLVLPKQMAVGRQIDLERIFPVRDPLDGCCFVK